MRTFALTNFSTAASVLIFLVSALLTAALIEALRTTVEELAISNAELAENNSLLETVLEGVPDPLYVKDREGRFVRANSATAQLLGTRRDALQGKRASDLVRPEAARAIEASDEDVLRTRHVSTTEELVGVGAAAATRCYLSTKAPWYGPKGQLLGLIGISRDIEDLKQAERRLRASDEQKTLLLADINHRIKNSLQSIAASLEVARFKLADGAAHDAIGAAVRQLIVLARVFNRLHLHGSVSRVDIQEFLEGLCDDLKHSVVTDAIAVRTAIESYETTVDRAVSLGLIVNELVTNSIKHAFPEDRDGTIAVRLRAEDGRLRLEIADDGVGLAEGRQASGSGRRLVQSLAHQVGGAASWARNAAGGTTVRVEFPEEESLWPESAGEPAPKP